MHPEAEEFKKQGNDAVKAGKYIEAMLHYTRAIKVEPNDHTLYSNRSLAFLKMQQYYHAVDDAQHVMKLKPEWPKGYYRKGEAEFHAEHYKEALASYRQGLSLEPEDTGLQDAVVRATKELRKQRTYEARIPWAGLGIGLLLGILLLIGDHAVADKPVLTNVILQVLISVVSLALGYGLALAYRWFLRSQRSGLLDAPIDLFPEESTDGGNNAETSSDPATDGVANQQARLRKGTAASGRQRYKKGKS